MYKAFFYIEENPFSLTPDPRYLYLSQRHREALAHLLYGMGESGGFVQLTGEVGTGKTTLCRSVLEQAPEEVDVALIWNPNQTAIELLASVCDELRIAYPAATSSIKVLIDLLNRHLLAAHARNRRTVLIIDEAQNLTAEALEQVRLLTNLETTTRKLLQIILIGQPELQDLMARPDLRQLAQRITARYHLTPLNREETGAYIEHRLDVAGCHRPVFTPRAVRVVHRLSQGVPRLINIICDRAMLGAYGRHQSKIGPRLVRNAYAEVRGNASGGRRPRWGAWAAAAAAVALAAAAVPMLPQWLAPEARLEVVEPPPALPRQTPPPEPPAPGSAETGPANAQPQTGPETAAGPQAPAPTAVEPEPEAAAQPPAAPPLEELLLSRELPTDTESAFAVLLRRWGLIYDELEGPTGCVRASTRGLGCLFRRGTWTKLGQHNRPAVLELIDRAQNRHHVVVTGLSGDSVTLDFGARQLAFPRREVEALWYGSYMFLWQPPPQGSTLIRPGSDGEDVAWLRRQLDRLDGGPAPGAAHPAEGVFDDLLRGRVIAFQRAQGLKPDGLAGELTLLELNTVLSDGAVPVLRLPAAD